MPGDVVDTPQYCTPTHAHAHTPCLASTHYRNLLQAAAPCPFPLPRTHIMPTGRSTFGHKALAAPLGHHRLDVPLLSQLAERQRRRQAGVPLLQATSHMGLLQANCRRHPAQRVTSALQHMHHVQSVTARMPLPPQVQRQRRWPAPLTCTSALGGRPHCAACACMGSTPTLAAICLHPAHPS